MVSFNKIVKSASKSVTSASKTVSKGATVVTNIANKTPAVKVINIAEKQAGVVTKTVVAAPKAIATSVMQTPKTLGGVVGDITGGLTKNVGSILPDKQTLMTYGGIAVAGLFAYNKYIR